MRFLLLFTQLAILAASLDAAPVAPSHRRLGRRQTDGSVLQLTPDAITDDIPANMAQMLGAVCSVCPLLFIYSVVLLLTKDHPESCPTQKGWALFGIPGSIPGHLPGPRQRHSCAQPARAPAL